MASKHLSEDEIKYVINADSSKAQQALHKLEKETSSLRTEEKRRKSAMVELEAAGKKNSDEYKHLSEECKEYSSKIRDNEKQMRSMRSAMDLIPMTMNELKKHSKELHRELDDMSKSANPEEYAKLESRLRDVDGRIAELKQNAKGLKESLTGDIVNGNILAQVFVKVASLFGDLAGKMRDFIGQGIEMAESADGITHAFRQLNNPGLLDKLRKATKGTVNDVELMKAAVKAKDFRIPLEDLGKYLSFAQLKAQQTGQSLDYMVDSIVTGLGRKSPLILDNLGLSAAEISEKTKQTGDFMKAVASIVENQLSAAGKTYISAADKSAQRTTALENAQLQMGQSLLSVKEVWADAYGNMAISIMRVITWMGTHRKATLLLTIAIAGFNVAMSAANLKLKEFIVNSTLAKVAISAWNTVVTSVKGISLLFANVIATMSGNTTRATAAMKLFNQTCKANVYILAATAILAIVTALVYLTTKSQKVFDLSKQMKATYDEIKQIQNQTKAILRKDIDDINKSVNDSVAKQTSKVKILTDTIKDNSKSVKERKAALEELKKIVPAYHAQLTNEGRLINNNTIALNDYIKALRKTAMEQAIVGKMTTIANSELNNQLDKQHKQGNLNYVMNQAARGGINLKKQKVVAVQVKDSYGAQYGHPFDTVYQVVDKATGKVVKGMNNVSDRFYKLQSIYDYRIEGMKANDERTKQNNARNSQLESFAKNNRINLANAVSSDTISPSSPTSRTTSTTRSTPVDKVGNAEKTSFTNNRKQELQEEEASYQQSLNNLKQSLGDKADQKEKYDSLTAGLELLHASNMLRIEKKYTEDSQKLHIKNANDKQKITLEQQANEDKAQQTYNEKSIAAKKLFSEMMQNIEDASMTDSEKQEQQQNLKLLSLKGYYDASLVYARQNGIDENSITEAYEKAKKKIIEDNELEIQQKKQQIREQYGLVTQQEQLDEELQQLKKQLDDKLLSQEDYEKAAAEIKQKYADKTFQNRQQLGLVSQKQIYDQELTQLRQHLEEVKATEEESAKAVTDLKVKQWKEQFDYYSSIFSSSFTSLQDAELAVVDAKYDAELQSAKGNSEKTEMLEKKKANAELKVKKKFADVNFAITAAQIIANTAAGVAYQFTHLPLAAAIATGVLVSAAGTAQLVAANAEREKVKKMSLESTGSSSSSSGARVATGRESGGNIDVQREQDGKLFNAQYDPNKRGYIDRPTVIVGEGPYGQSKEWVASNAALNNPTIAPIIDIIDQHQRAGTLQMLDMNKYLLQQQNRGLSSGGYVSPQSDTSASNTSNNQLIEKFYKLLLSLQENGIPATVALDDFDAKQKLRDQARKMASK